LLTDNPFFHDLDPAFLTTIAGCARNVSFEPGTVIFREGDPADRFFVLREGRVALAAFELDQGSAILQTLNPGDVLGWSWLVPPHKWLFDARSVTRVRAFEFDATCVRSKCEEDPRLGYALLDRFIRLLEHRLQATRLQLIDMYKNRM
jgi:CRP-like cAMP-binding protein